MDIFFTSRIILQCPIFPCNYEEEGAILLV